ncbi:MAG: TlpA disulfide reductase family protein [Bacteroidota bacterium]
MKSRILHLLLLLLPIVGCRKPIPEESIWTGTMTLADQKQLPLRMSMNLGAQPPAGSFIVGDESTPIPEIEVTGDSIIVHISEYQAALRGVWDGKEWKGNFFRYRKDTLLLPFVARPGEPLREPTHTTPSTAIRLTGSFRVYYHEPDGIDSMSTAKFWSRGDSVFGTFIDPSGDHGLMAGIQRGDSAWVGRFIGWQANLLELYFEEGSWKGKYYARQFPPEVFTLVPQPGAEKEQLDKRRTRLKEPRKPFRFEGLTIEGDTVRNNDARFRGKALIVDIMGTWCHNCLDEAPLLQRLHEEFNDDGLEIVGLSFEVTEDAVTGRNNLAIYKKRHGLTFPLLFAGSLDANNVDSSLHSQLDDFFAYPTTLFIDRKGRVRDIHWGFKGPGTGEDYQREVERFYQLVKEILH